MKFRLLLAGVFSLLIFGIVGSFFVMEDGVVSAVSKPALGIPIPEKLLGVSTLTDSKELWKPRIPRIGSPPDDLALTAVSAISYDLSSDRLLYARNIEERLPLASLTKIMTAIVALETFAPDQKLEVTDADLVGENSMGLLSGEKLLFSELMYGMMLPSGNDAAEVVARNSPYGRENFVYLMNKKAEDLGLYNTRFTNPSGLEGDGTQYSSTYDLLVMTRYALQNKTFAEIVETVEHTVPASDTNQEYYLYNETNLLTSYPGVKGVKTGYTYEAGMCLVTYLEYKDHKIIAVVLNSSNRRQEMKDLLDYSLTRLGEEPPAHE